MAITPSVSLLNATVGRLETIRKIRVGQVSWCFGVLSFGASDTYATGGFDIRPQIRALFGVSHVEAILFLGSSSDGSGAQTNATSRVQARYVFTPGTSITAQTGLVYLYAVGRTTASATNASEVEMAAGDSINNLTFNFLAICSGEGSSLDSKALS